MVGISRHGTDNPSRSIAVVLVSGGLDSCVTAATARRQNDLALLHLDYRQRTRTRELRSFNEIADYYQTERRLIVDLSYMRQIGGSSLVDPTLPIPIGTCKASVPNTYVPFRNANLLGVGVAWAETIGASQVFIGAHQQGSLYPDCQRDFFSAYNQMVAVGTKAQTCIRIQTPLIDLEKTAIIRLGVKLGAPLHLTWSCYQNAERACGHCHSCQLRLAGFSQAGLEDPLPYE